MRPSTPHNESSSLNPYQPINFVTLGMFIIDEIHFQPPTPSVYNILGGAGSYAALGARIFSPAPQLSKTIGWVVDEGSDFPDEVRQRIHSWETSCRVRKTPERLTTRGWNGYGGSDERRAFRYTTSKLRLDHESLDDNLLQSSTFHLICSPTRCIDLVKNILSKRKSLSKPLPEPIFIWEPVPDLCIPEELDACQEALKYIQVVSPNHAELCGFFGVEEQDEAGRAARNNIEQCCREWLSSGVGNDGNGAIVVRAGKEGCYLATQQQTRWIPAFHQNPFKVVDPTGGGNAFLGGLGVGLARAGGSAEFGALHSAAIWGSVSASFAIEQVGMPELRKEETGELWNAESPMERVTELERRTR